MQAKWNKKDPVPPDTSDPVSNQLLALNRALTQLNEDDDALPNSRPVSYHVESIERPRKRSGGGRKGIGDRLSYVEHSYNRLTNDMYSSKSLYPVEHSHDLDAWAGAEKKHY